MGFSLFCEGWGLYPGQEQNSGYCLKLSISGWVLRGWRGRGIQSMNLRYLHAGTSETFSEDICSLEARVKSALACLGLTWGPCLVLVYLGVGAQLFSLHSPAETPISMLSLPGTSWSRRMTMTSKSSWRILMAERGWKFHHEEEWRAVKTWRREKCWIYSARRLCNAPGVRGTLSISEEFQHDSKQLHWDVLTLGYTMLQPRKKKKKK